MIEALSWAFRLQISQATTKFVLVALADYANESLECYPSINALIKKTCLNKKTIHRAISSLIGYGLIEDTGERVGSTGRVRVYRIVIDPEMEQFRKWNSSENGPEIDPKTDCNRTENGRQLTQKRVTYSIRNRQEEPSEEPPVLGDGLLDSLKAVNGSLTPDNYSVISKPTGKLSTERMLSVWTQWQEFRRTKPKVKDWTKLFNAQLEWLSGFDEATAYEILSSSLRNGYQGLFPPKNHPNGNSGYAPPPGVQLRALQVEVDKHPANRDSVFFDQGCTEAQRKQLKDMRCRLSDLNRQVAMSGVGQ